MQDTLTLDAVVEETSTPSQDASLNDDPGPVDDPDTDVTEPEPEPAVGPITLPQAIGGALHVNPTLFSNPTLVVSVESATSVDVVLGDATFTASLETGSGMWVANLDLSNATSGDHDLQVLAHGAGGEETTDTWSLRVAEGGLAHTIYEEVGAARTPCLHRGDDSLWLTWTDNREDPRRLYAQALDGAGRAQGEPISLTPPGVDIRYGRTSFDGNRFGVLYQTGGGSYENRFLLVETDGTVVAGPVALDDADWLTTGDGWISFDGEAFVGVYRNYTDDDSSVFWFRADPETGALTGPLAIADAGDENPIGGFTLPSFVRVAGKDGTSMVTFTRDVYDGLFDMMIPQGWVVTVSSDGSILADGGLPVPLTWPFAYEAHAWVVGDVFVPVWTANSLMDEELNPPHRIFGALVQEPATDPGAYEAKLWLNAPRMRGEMALIPHPKHLGVMAWSDERTDVGIYLHVGPVDPEEGVTQDLLIPEARFLAMNAHLNGVPLGTNSLIVWLDDRKGGTVGNPMSEVTLETLWF